MANESQRNSLSIQADDKDGHLTGTGTLSLSGDEGSVMAAFQRQDDGKTQVTLGLKKDVAISADESLAFGGHVDLDPRNGKLTAGTQITYTVDNSVAADLQTQFGPGGPSGQLNLKIAL